MSMLTRLWMATQTGIRTAWLTYRYGALAPLTTLAAQERADWESYEARLFRYVLADLYYHNKVFTELERFRVQHLSQRGLYKYTRGLYNPVFRYCKLVAAKCYGGVLDWENMAGGAVPFDGLPSGAVEAIRNLWKWSNFGVTKTVYANQAVRFGDGVIKVVDDPERGKVWFEMLHPGLIRQAWVDAVGHVQRVIIEYERLDETTGRPYLYREEIDGERFATYRVEADGTAQLWAYRQDADGNPVAEWANPYGFVPLALAQAEPTGRAWGQPPYHAVLDKVDQVNDLASLLADQVRKSVNPVWYMAGVQSVKQMQEETLVADEQGQAEAERGSVPILLGPAGSQPHAMVTPLDLDAGLATVDALLREIERDLPELTLHRMRDSAPHSAPAVALVYDDVLDRLQEVRANLDAALLRAHQMALTIGGVNGYPGFERFGADDYARGNLDFQIADRPIFRDNLSQRERLELLLQSDAPQAWVWDELGKTEAEIAQATAERLAVERAVAADVARALATGVVGEE
jgi:hypothetical protein